MRAGRALLPRARLARLALLAPLALGAGGAGRSRWAGLALDPGQAVGAGEPVLAVDAVGAARSGRPGVALLSFWLQVICVSRLVQRLRSELLGPDGSISLIVPVAFSLQAV